MNNEEKNTDLIEDQAEENNAAPEAPKKNNSGLITILITIVACVLVAVVLIVALLPKDSGNGGEDGSGNVADGKVTYTVNVVDQDGNPVKDVAIKFYPAGGIEFEQKTQADGKTSYTTDKDMQVALTAIPAGYEAYDKLNTKQNLENGNLTVTLTKTEVEATYYHVKVVDQNGDPVQGVAVQVCSATKCLTGDSKTDENGEASFQYTDSEDYHAALNSIFPLPEGYSVDDPDKEYAIVDGVATIVLTKE